MACRCFERRDVLLKIDRLKEAKNECSSFTLNGADIVNDLCDSGISCINGANFSSEETRISGEIKRSYDKSRQAINSISENLNNEIKRLDNYLKQIINEDQQFHTMERIREGRM